MILLLAALLATQTPMPKGTGLPPPGTDEAAVMVPVDALFAALAARDPALAAPYLLPEGDLTIADERDDGTREVRRTSFVEFAATLKPGPEKYEERIYNPAIEIDGDIALVWGRYDFIIDGKLSHCGVDHFNLVREAGRWKIANLSYSKRRTGCGG